MFSMTGYGRGEYKQGGLEVVAEIKTVNNRYLDVSLKCPRILSSYEDVLRGVVREKLTRGHADVYISFTDKRENRAALSVDLQAAKAWVDMASQLKEVFPELENDFTVSSLMRQQDVLKQEDLSCDEELAKGAKAALLAALDKLNIMRKTEGEKLAKDMLSRVDLVETLVSKVKERAPLVAADYKKRLEEKIKNYLDGVNYDEGRLLTEVAVFTDKSNIDEELTRLGSHISQFREIASADLVGRKLDFLVQEFNRETNTICSKSNDLAITKLGLELKNEIEKIREQVQNVE
ncbi:MAG: YicC/YloC family endoribonuclease [Candidatus Coproplasma sp.]